MSNYAIGNAVNLPNTAAIPPGMIYNGPAPGMYDPMLKLLGENNALRQQIADLEKQRDATPYSLPGFAFSAVDGGLSLMGLLWLRLYPALRQDMFNIVQEGALFHIGNTSFIAAVPATHQGNSSVAVVCTVKDDVLTIYDDATLFPSDSLLIKLRTIWST